MKDNAMFNFGKQQEEIVLIDAGSRPKVPSAMSKSKSRSAVQPAIQTMRAVLYSLQSSA
jgi:hypothetical protein